LGFPHFCAPTAAISKNYPFSFSKKRKNTSVLRKERRYEILLRKAAAAKCSQYRLPRRRGEKLHPCARRTAADLRRREPDRFGLQHAKTGIRTKFAAEVEESGELVVNARLIGEILRRLPDDVVTFTANDKFLIHLTCGDADFDIMGLSAADFPELPEVEEKYAVQIAEKTLKTMIQQTSFAVSTNEARPVHMGSLFEVSAEGLTVVSVDGFRLALRKEALEKIEGGAFSFVAPGTALNEVERICERSTRS